MRPALPRDFWTATPMSRAPFLVELREMVQQSHGDPRERRTEVR